ncbi:hypothetical protein O181_003708 [Austropuccinia psidii MF-1]|uniref:Uncharacterized protein n=1 Tax=Austropuccinia psidii MF-1 TaxID=1389203 RepID=A0A9Q3BF73_9BASI|nr:hypothetical protein [Austropuccinia psidii MF-1]
MKAEALIGYYWFFLLGGPQPNHPDSEQTEARFSADGTVPQSGAVTNSRPFVHLTLLNNVQHVTSFLLQLLASPLKFELNWNRAFLSNLKRSDPELRRKRLPANHECKSLKGKAVLNKHRLRVSISAVVQTPGKLWAPGEGQLFLKMLLRTLVIPAEREVTNQNLIETLSNVRLPECKTIAAKFNELIMKKPDKSTS